MEYVTSRGVKIKFVGIANLIRSLQKSLDATKPMPPKYSVKTMGGAVEWHDHDATTINTQEEKDAYASYLAKKAEWDTESNYKLMRLILIEGIEIPIPANGDWKNKQRALGIDIPENTDDDPFKERIHYIETEIIGSKQDYKEIFLGVTRIAGVSEEDLSAAEDLFRSQTKRDSAEPAANAPERMGSEPGV